MGAASSLTSSASPTTQPRQGVDLRLPPLVLVGVAGGEDLGARLGAQYLHHIAQTQAHKFVEGLPGLRSFARIGKAAKRVLEAGKHQQRGGNGGAVAGSGSSWPPQQQQQQQAEEEAAGFVVVGGSRRDALPRVPVGLPPGPLLWPDYQEQQQASLAEAAGALLRAVASEALNLGINVAAGAEFVLQGGAPAGQPAPQSAREGLAQASCAGDSVESLIHLQS